VKYALASVLTAVSVLAVLTFMVMLMAGGANAKPAQITQIKVMLLASVMIGLACTGGAVWAMVAGRPMTGAWIGATPTVLCVATVIVMIKLEW
jgi:hypothetical protein